MSIRYIYEHKKHFGGHFDDVIIRPRRRTQKSELV